MYPVHLFECQILVEKFGLLIKIHYICAIYLKYGKEKETFTNT